jgi:hypothetical protein
MPTATKAMRLIEIGLETEEDEVWDRIAAQRDQKGATFHPHSEVFAIQHRSVVYGITPKRLQRS